MYIAGELLPEDENDNRIENLLFAISLIDGVTMDSFTFTAESESWPGVYLYITDLDYNFDRELLVLSLGDVPTIMLGGFYLGKVVFAKSYQLNYEIDGFEILDPNLYRV